MTLRLASGVPGLDEVLGGGLNPNSLTLVGGTPGSGKTILAQRLVFETATPERPAVYLSTVSEPFDKILRFGQTLEFFDVGRIGTSVFYEDLGAALVTQGLAGVAERIDSILKRYHPGLLVIDSFKAFSAFAGSDSDYRRFLHELVGRLGAVAVSVVLIGEYMRDELMGCPEFAIADSVIYLGNRRTVERETRALSVMKHRGSAYAAGEHSYRIGAAGLRVFPRLADVSDTTPYELRAERASTGITALDEVLHDGYWPGSATLIAGPSGVGKTLMGLHFLFAGAQVGEPGVLATLQENRMQLDRIGAGFGFVFDESGVTVMDRSPVDMYLDEWAHELLATIERTGAKRVVIDSLGDLSLASADELRFREFVYSLLQRFSRSGVSVMMTVELPNLFRTERIGELGMSHIADNVVLLQHVIDDGEIKRGLAILKTRGSRHDARLREFLITSEGIAIGEPFASHAFLG